MAGVAELETGMISPRTKAALAAAKRRGVKLGGDRGVKPKQWACSLSKTIYSERDKRLRKLLKAQRKATGLTQTVST